MVLLTSPWAMTYIFRVLFRGSKGESSLELMDTAHTVPGVEIPTTVFPLDLCGGQTGRGNYTCTFQKGTSQTSILGPNISKQKSSPTTTTGSLSVHRGLFSRTTSGSTLNSRSTSTRSTVADTEMLTAGSRCLWTTSRLPSWRSKTLFYESTMTSKLMEFSFQLFLAVMTTAGRLRMTRTPCTKTSKSLSAIINQRRMHEFQYSVVCYISDLLC